MNNEIPRCDFCGRTGDFDRGCCGFHVTMGCRAKRACATCAKFHSLLARFAAAICKTKFAERANSSRARYFRLLTRTVLKARESDALAKADYDHIQDVLARLSGGAFSTDENNFQRTVFEVVRTLPPNRAICQAIIDAGFELKFEEAAIAADRDLVNYQERKQWVDETAAQIDSNIAKVGAQHSFTMAFDAALKPKRNSVSSFKQLLNREIAKCRAVRSL